MTTTHLIDPKASTEAKIQYLLDREELHQLILDIRAFDTPDWDKYINVFDETVRMDVSEQGEFWKGKITDFAEMIKPVFAELDASQHLILPTQISIEGDDASMQAYVRGYERKVSAPGGSEHRISAVYFFKAKRRSAGWKITEMVKKVMWHDGNIGVLPE